jgi:hypothetical protein
MPRANELPPTLAPLALLNAVEINPTTFDTSQLIATVDRTLADLEAPSDQHIAELELEWLYDQALAAFWNGHWDKAVDLLGRVLSR